MTKRSKPKLPIFDGHNDTLVHLYLPQKSQGRSFFKENKKGHLDLPRAKKAGLFGAIFAICVPPPKSRKESDPMYGVTITKNGYRVKMRRPITHSYAKNFTNSVVNFLYNLEKKANGQIKIVRKYQDLKDCLENDALAVVLHFEGAEMIKKDLGNLERFYDQGLRALGLVWSRPNVFGTGVPYRFPHSPDTGPGLTRAGKALVKECNRLGIMIDLTHLNQKGFWDVAKLSKAPLVVSHTAVHALCPSTRNLTDAQIDAVGESKGLIGVFFEPAHIRADGKPNRPNTPLTTIVDHLGYIAQRIGIDHVALGSDFDGTDIPRAIGDVTGLPRLIKSLQSRGYRGRSLEKIAYKNWLRIFKSTWHE